MRNRVRISGFTVLFIGVAALLFTFVNAYMLLMGFGGVLGSGDLINVFGEALAPLISYAIRALYLGVMGWIGSILTRRGVQIITSGPKEEGVQSTTKTEEEVQETKEVKRAEGTKSRKRK